MKPVNKNTNSRLRLARNQIRNLHLNSSPMWYLIKKRGSEIPPYVADTAYVRKVRLIYTATATPQTITYLNINNAVFGTAMPFERMFIRRIEAWGLDTSQLTLTTYIAPSATMTVKSRDFSDFGVPGQSRANVAVDVSPKDSDFISVFSAIACVATVTPVTTATDLVIDFWVTFQGSISV